jgi:hypothetical protein
LLQKNNLKVPETWLPLLSHMCEYVATCQGIHGETVEFGDSDNSKILDLAGGEWPYYRYILALFSLLLPTRYYEGENAGENSAWLFSAEEIAKARQKPPYTPPPSVCCREGGVTILRSPGGRALIGIDHGGLGFGKIAAHGHADALSFQMYLGGEPLFIDPGTYIYHIDRGSRDAFRHTGNHNTATVGGRPQSQMLGAFLWGRRARCILRGYRAEGGKTELTAEHDGYAPETHRRAFAFNGRDELKITDSFQTNASKEIHFVLAPAWKINYDNETKTMEIACGQKAAAVSFRGDEALQVTVGKAAASRRYGQKHETLAVTVATKGLMVETTINWGNNGE